MKATIKPGDANTKRKWFAEIDSSRKDWTFTTTATVPGEWVELSVSFVKDSQRVLLIDEIMTKDLQPGFYGVMLTKSSDFAVMWDILSKSGNTFTVKYTPMHYNTSYNKAEATVYNSTEKDSTVTGQVIEVPVPSNPVTAKVTNLEELKNALYNDAYREVGVNGTIKGTGSLNVKPNKRLYGVKGVLDGLGLYLFETENIILEDLTIRNVKVVTESSDNDNVNIKFGTRNVKILHCDFYNDRTSDNWGVYDGLVDITRSVTDVEIAWSKLHDTHKALLWHQPADEKNPPEMRVTMHHSHIYNVSERAPDCSTGKVFLYNNLFENISGSGVTAFDTAEVCLLNNYFLNCNRPVITQQKERVNGRISGLETNMFKYCTSPIIRSLRGTWMPEVPADLIPVDQVPTTIKANAGPRS